LMTFFLAFSASLLGVSGFESSANFVEEQQPGVFRKTLRNMLIGVAIFNPLISYVILNLATITQINEVKDYILAEVAFNIGGLPLMGLIATDALLVLSGAVLTGYVGVSGLIKRMALDECLPSFLLRENKKGSYPVILLTFFTLCSSILVVTRGNLLSLAGVYTISFLGVMTMFAIGNLILRKNRPLLKRKYKAPIIFVFLAALATFAGVIGNLSLDRANGLYFLIYFIPALAGVMMVIFRADVFRTLMQLSGFYRPLHQFWLRLYERSLNPRYYLFLHKSSQLFEFLTYIKENEAGKYVRVIHCVEGGPDEHATFREVIPALYKAGVYPDFNIDLDFIDEPFSPESIDRYAKRHRIEKNRIFIGAIKHHHSFDYEELGGVRIISS
ncbi:APC family permease, partial [candidate division WWE3 bacterium]|nr:APC family permease [candidate division WWE3 bacterium]